MQALQQQKESAAMNLARLSQSKLAPVDLKDYKQILAKIKDLLEKDTSPEIKAKIARLLIHKVLIYNNSVEIQFNFDSKNFGSILKNKKRPHASTYDIASRSSQVTNIDRLNAKNPARKKLSVPGSYCLTNGGLIRHVYK